MKYGEKDQIPLNTTLEEKGWLREGSRLYAPHKTFWTEGVNNEYVPRQILIRMFEKMKEALETMPQIEHLYADKEHFENWVKDTQSMVNTLEELLKDNPHGT